MQPTVFNTDLSSQAIEVLLLKKFLTLSYTFYPLARLNSHDLRESSRVHGGKAAEDMRADVQRKCLWSPLKNSRERVNSVWTLQLLDHENLQQRRCLIIPKQNKREQLQGAVLTHWDTEKERREWQKKRGARHLSSNWSQTQNLSQLLLNRSIVHAKASAFWHNGKVLFGSVMCENSDEKTLKAFTAVTCGLYYQLQNQHLLISKAVFCVYRSLEVSWHYVKL